MDIHIDTELRTLKEKLAASGGCVELALRLALEGLLGRSTEKFDEIMELETKINNYQIEIDELCLQIIALNSPRASDLRFILAAYKINNDLERMGDLIVNIKRNSEDYFKRGVREVEIYFEPIAKEVIGMVTSSLTSFIKVDEKLANNVLDRDDWVDEQRNLLFKEMKNRIRSEPNEVDAYLDLLLIARNLERIADLSTNIAEDAVFLSSGKDIRHGHSGD